MREIPKEHLSSHHLVPRSLGGKNGRNVVKFHSVCHKYVHAVFTRKDLKYKYNTVKKIKETRRIKKFVKWLSRKPVTFDISIKESRKYKRKKKRI